MPVTRSRPSRERYAGMNQVDAEDLRTVDQLTNEVDSLRERVSVFAETGVRINESLEFDVVLQSVLASACSLTSARYGVMTLLDDNGGVQDFLASGMTA